MRHSETAVRFLGPVLWLSFGITIGGEYPAFLFDGLNVKEILVAKSAKPYVF